MQATIQLADINISLDESFIKKIFKNELNNGEIDADYYFRVAQKLSEAVSKGLNGDSFKATDYRNTLKAHLDHNVFAFSAAKNFKAYEFYKNALTDEKGEPVSYNRFRDKVTEMDVEFNDNWLRTEYNSAMSMAQAADKWQKLQAFEYLEYRTVGDNRVRASHEKLDGKVFKTNDPVWNTIYPPNDWGCRCTVVPAAKGAKANTFEEVKADIKAANIQPYFQKNAGKGKVVFHDDHPFFESMKNTGLKINELSATKNYNLKTIEQIYRNTKELPEIEIITPEQAKAWFEKLDKKGKDIITKDGIAVSLDKSFYDKMIASPSPEYAERIGYAHKVTDVMQHPDEVWSHFHSGKLQTSYIKYYKDKPYMVAVKENNGKMQFETFFKVDRDGIIQQRRAGVLKFRK